MAYMHGYDYCMQCNTTQTLLQSKKVIAACNAMHVVSYTNSVLFLKDIVRGVMLSELCFFHSEYNSDID